MASPKNEQRDVKGQCQVLWFPWKQELLSASMEKNYTLLSDSEVFDISNHLVQSCVFSKNRGAPAGSFNLKLDNSRDWKEIIRPGQWLCIFMSNEGDLALPDKELYGKQFHNLPGVDARSIKKNRLRGMCYIERVTVNTIQEEGVLDVVYEVSGRDYGVCYEETQIWFNYFQFEQMQVQGLSDSLQFSNQKTIKELLEITHDLFYAPGKVIKGKTDPAELFGEVGVQWLLPKKMLSLLGIQLDGQYSFFGNIANLKKFSKSISTISIVDPLSYINGNAWERLKQFSVKELHELYAETDDDGTPNLIFRPIPWAIDKRGYPGIAGKLDPTLFYSKLNDAVGVKIRALDLISSAVGEDNHNRYNHFFVTSKATFAIAESNISTLKGQKSQMGREYPNIQKGSIRRHGFRPMHVDVDTLGQFTDHLDVDKKIILEANELIYDYWNSAVFFESGTFSIIGNNAIKVGKTLDFDADVPYHGEKIFYIEEYTDEFAIEENGVGVWTQTITASRGIEKADLAALSGFSKKGVEFDGTGDWQKG